MAKSAEDTWRDARKWIDDNPRAWRSMLSNADFYAQRGMRFSIRELADVVRFHMATNGHTDGYKMANGLHPAFARIMLRQHPEWSPYLATAKSKLDEVMPHEG